MSDKRASLTPIIVGAVIALLGILVGLYIADNAREQLSVLQAESAVVSQDAAAQASMMPMSEEQLTIQELPPLEPIVQEPEVVQEEDEPIEEVVIAEKKEAEDTTILADEEFVSEEPVKVEENAEPVEEEEDDFEEVPLEVINN